ncbi:hypothetical protein [Streptomyces scabiei]|uniref:hypothetical protein n=1 Tax=Streptomyces scabiei TaxID=1930 RepID=UPI0037BC82DA
MTKTLHVPGQIRRHVLKQGEGATTTPGEKDLFAACLEGAKELERQGRNTLNSIDLNLTNAALGAALNIAYDWLDSTNGNNVMAAKTMMKLELEYEPDDPREIRHEIKMPKSLERTISSLYIDNGRLRDASEVLVDDLNRMSWTNSGASGRVRAETLGWFLDKAQYLRTMYDHSAVKRAAQKFLDTYTEPYERTTRLINGYLGTGEDEDQAPAPEKDDAGTLTADGFKAAIRGRGPELEDDEPAAVEVEDQEPETPSREWKKYRMSHYVNWSGKRVFFYYGGPAKKAVNENGPLVYVSWKESYEGTNLLRDAKTGEVIDTVHSMANVWGVDAEEPEGFTDPKAEAPEVEVKDPLLDLIAETAPPKGGYEVPANFLELAEEGNTDQAKAYWKRRCEQYRRTGK